MQTWQSSVFMLLGLIGSMASPMTGSYAEEPGAMVDGAGFTLYGTESIKGSDAAKVERDPDMRPEQAPPDRQGRAGRSQTGRQSRHHRRELRHKGVFPYCDLQRSLKIARGLQIHERLDN